MDRWTFPPFAARRFASFAAALAALILTVAIPAAARADALGQLQAWGAKGAGAGQLLNPRLLGVDPVDGSVYVADQSADFNTVRVQKFSSTGAPEGLASISRPLESSSRKVFLGIAVDHALHRIYLLQFKKKADTSNNEAAAQQILVFSTDPNGGVLEPPAGGPATLPVPDPTLGEAIDNPRSLELDPNNHDLIVAGENRSKQLVLQRIGSDGSFGARYTETAGVLPTEIVKAQFALAVGPDGAAYMLTGLAGQQGKDNTRLWALPQSFTGTPQQVPGFAAAAQREEWGQQTQLAPLTLGGMGFGPQLAISPDGKTAYWKEQLTASTSGVPGLYMVRRYSLANDSTASVFGGGSTEGACAIQSNGAALAASGDDVFVLDPGPEGNPPAYGVHVFEFGPGGSGCSAPFISFTAAGSSNPTVTVTKGALVDLDGSGSELHGETPETLTWSGSGPEPFTTPVTGAPPSLGLDRRFLQAGTYELGLEVRFPTLVLTSSRVWSATPKTLVVEAATPIAKFSPSTSSPVPGVAVDFDAGASEDPTGSCTASGCGPSNALEEYHWDFGDGTTETTSTATASHTFSNATASPIARTVSLTVTSNDEVTSAPVSHDVSVQVEPANPVLTVSETGPGTVTSSPAGISCGATCQAEFDPNQVVELTAAASPHAIFTGWTAGSGDPGTCTGATSPCQVTLSASKSLSATFAPIAHLLTVAKTGSGAAAGTVTSSPAGISCGATCSHSFDEGSSVTLTAAAGSGSAFSGWTSVSGDPGTCAGTTSPCQIAIDAAKEISAGFAVNPPTASNLGAEEVTKTGAKLRGTVNDHGADGGASCIFQVSLASDPSFSAPVATPACSPATVSGSTDTPVTASVTGLTPNTEYVYRVRATNAGGTATGTPASSFKTPGATPPVPLTGSADAIGQTGATLKGTVNPSGLATTCRFEYVDDATFQLFAFAGATSANCAAAVGAGGSPVAVSAAITGLAAGTTYHVRLAATNADGTAKGGDVQLTTTGSSSGGGSGGSGTGGQGGAQQPGGSAPSGGSGAAAKPKTLAQKRAAARAKCRRLKGRAKAGCMKKANAIGKPKRPAKRH